MFNKISILNKKIIFFTIIFGFLLANYAFSVSCNVNALRPVKFKQKNQDVKNFQACLIAAGYNIPSGPTGYYGNETKKAVISFYSEWYGNWHGNFIDSNGIKKLKELLTSKIISQKDKKSKKPMMIAFSSKKDFKDYIYKSQQINFDIYTPVFPGTRFSLESVPITSSGILESISFAEKSGVERVSVTNVQFIGIDEPDIVKTDGRSIYYSQETLWKKFPESGYWNLQSKTQIIQAFPPSDLKVQSKIDDRGDLFLVNKKLIILSQDKNSIIGYDVSDPSAPQRIWSRELKNSYLVTARLFKNKIYLIIKSYINVNNPCPLSPLSELTIFCNNIYHPNIFLPADVLYSVIVINPENGNFEKAVSFVGSNENSVVYMSDKNVYLTYYDIVDSYTVFSQFIRENPDLFDSSIIQEINKLDNMDIVNQAKLIDLTFKLGAFLNSLDENQVLKVENESKNRFSDFLNKNKEKFERTIIVRVDNENLEIKATGEIPGSLLNQFALDEYNNYLRVASTIGRFVNDFGFFSNNLTNGLYVLDDQLNIVGKIKDFGLNERIYAVRFVGNLGYVVTFRETDPFFVADLTNPTNPKLRGELKIPGFSSYLHPLDEKNILGVGREGSNVKLSIFNVDNPDEPKEISKYTLQEYWSEVLNNHRAFLLDEKHKIFFLPAGNNGYVFSYDGYKLELKKALKGEMIKRAVFINDYLYVIGEKVIVIDEYNWEIKKELDLKD